MEVLIIGVFKPVLELFDGIEAFNYFISANGFFKNGHELTEFVLSFG